MPAGTITLTNNTTSVNGSGTAFSTELKANDFLVAVVGGTTYTLGIKSVESATALTLTTVYGGPTSSGLAWTPIPNGTLVGITAQIAADTARAIRGLNYDKQNWQQVYSASGNITVTLPDGSTYAGPSWKYLSDNMATKANGAVPLTQGGTGLISPFGNEENTFCQGNDSRLNTIDGKNGGTISGGITTTTGDYQSNRSYSSELNQYGGLFRSRLYVNGYVKGEAYLGIVTIGAIRKAVLSVAQDPGQGSQIANSFYFDMNGNATSPGAWIPNSDGRLKNKVARIADPLGKMTLLKGCTWMRLDTGLWGIGFIAQDVAEAFPEAVHAGEDRELPDGTTVEKVLSPDTYGVAAALHHEAILALMDQVEKLKRQVEALQKAE
jgi:hypothetical protein